MHLSLRWLARYVDLTDLTPEALRDALTQSGLEIEGAIQTIGPRFNKVVVGRIEALQAHPDADKLRLVTVNRGVDKDSVQVVCGAPNVKQGLLIAFAEDGAQVINRKDGSLFTLGKATIRGVESTGMICSLEELGLESLYPQPEEPGIWPLNSLVNEAQLGQPLEEVLGLEKDAVLDSAPTANRGDQMSYLGVAREVAALFGRQVKEPSINAELATEVASYPTLTVELQPDDAACTYYAGAVLKNVRLGPSPQWLRAHLEAADVRSINNVVDITNFVMLELGQPLHAFDLDRLGHTGTISVRHAKAGEALTTLDDEERSLSEESLCITFNDQPVALAGLMGGASTEIQDDTTTVFLEAAWFNAADVRRSSRSVGLRTEASARFERGVDPGLVDTAMRRAVDLLVDLSGAEALGFVASGQLQADRPTLTLRLARLEQLIGKAYTAERVSEILTALGFSVTKQANDSVAVTVPAWRQTDVQKEIDLIEEVVRIDGYDAVPVTLPQGTAASTVSNRQRRLHSIRATLLGHNLQEVMTNSLLGPAWLERTGFPADERSLVTLTNSHSADHTIMRQSLLPSLLEVAQHNAANGMEATWLFELGRTYLQRGKASVKHSGVQERLSLAILLMGEPSESPWLSEKTTDFYTLKGMLESLIGSLGLNLSLTAEESTGFHPGQAAQVLAEGKSVGCIGQLHPQTRQRLKLKKPVFCLELDVDTLLKLAAKLETEPTVLKLSPYPSVQRDLALCVPDSISHQQLVSALKALQEPLLNGIQLFDEYKDEALSAQQQRSLAYRLTFQSPDRTLSDDEVEAATLRLREELQKNLSVTLR